MSDPTKPPSLDELGNRIAKARRSPSQGQPDGEDAGGKTGAQYGAAWRISIEIVVALVVCTGIGWALDYWLGTKPWLMLVFLFLGAAAGINNAVKTALKMDADATRAMKRGGGEEERGD